MHDLLRHSSLRSTLDIYTQAVTPAKHAAPAAVLSLVLLPMRTEKRVCRTAIRLDSGGQGSQKGKKGRNEGAECFLFASSMVFMR
jgi:hypothetical protein